MLHDGKKGATFFLMTNTTITKAELATVEALVRLGDSRELAVQTVINDRPSAAAKAAQLTKTKVFLVEDGDTGAKHQWTESQVANKPRWIKSAAQSAASEPGTWVAFGLFCIKQTWK